jgi:hypothetical protein
MVTTFLRVEFLVGARPLDEVVLGEVTGADDARRC